MTSEKYPRTPHLPYSPGGTSDDRRLPDVGCLLRIPLLLTEKMDGSNVCLESHDLDLDGTKVACKVEMKEVRVDL